MIRGAGGGVKREKGLRESAQALGIADLPGYARQEEAFLLLDIVGELADSVVRETVAAGALKVQVDVGESIPVEAQRPEETRVVDQWIFTIAGLGEVRRRFGAKVEAREAGSAATAGGGR